MTDPSAPPTREEAMAAIREAEIWTGDGGTIEMGSREDATTLLTLARAGAAVMFASDETVERVVVAPKLEVAIEKAEAFRDQMYRISEAYRQLEDLDGFHSIANDIDDALYDARAALAALSTPPPR